MESALLKQQTLRKQLSACKNLLIAFSGGVDSTYLLWEAHQVLGNRCLGVIADSYSLPRRELEEAHELSRHHALPLRVIQTHELENPDYKSNPINRCFYCKAELFDHLVRLAQSEGWSTIAYGENADDATDFRPGRQAAEKFQVVAPLRDAGLTKAEIRFLARQAGLEVADKPASPCLSSRVAQGQEVTVEKLRQIEQGEEFLLNRGFQIVRVRHQGERALVQVAPDETPRLLEEQSEIQAHLIHLGFKEIRFDPNGYRGPSLAPSR